MPTETIDVTDDGPALIITKNGQRVGALSVRTTALGNLQLVVEGVSEPVMAIGGDTYDWGVQFTRVPQDAQVTHVSYGNNHDVGCGDVYISGTLVHAPATVAYDANGNFRLPFDPRGCHVKARGYLNTPAQDLAMERLFVMDTNGGMHEYVRTGVSKEGFYGMGDSGSAFRLRVRIPDSTQLQLQHEDGNGHIAGIAFDNSGALKYTSPGNHTTTLAPGP